MPIPQQLDSSVFKAQFQIILKVAPSSKFVFFYVVLLSDWVKFEDIDEIFPDHRSKSKKDKSTSNYGHVIPKFETWFQCYI